MQSRSSFDFFKPRSIPRQRILSHYLQVLAIVSALTLDPNVPAGSDSKDEQETDEQERLEVVCGNTLSGENHGADKFALSCSEPSAEDDTEATTIGGGACEGMVVSMSDMMKPLRRTSCARLKNFGTAEQNRVLVASIDVQLFAGVEQLNRFLQ